MEITTTAVIMFQKAATVTVARVIISLSLMGNETSQTTVGISIKGFHANLDKNVNLKKDVSTVTHPHMVSMPVKSY